MADVAFVKDLSWKERKGKTFYQNKGQYTTAADPEINSARVGGGREGEINFKNKNVLHWYSVVYSAKTKHDQVFKFINEFSLEIVPTFQFFRHSNKAVE